MGYRKIRNLYQDTTILQFNECYAMEKVHGTSAHIQFIYDPELINHRLVFYHGGSNRDNFIALFDESDLRQNFLVLGHHDITIYGEAYGGKLQGMRATYGNELRFIAFEVKIGEAWLNVPNAHEVCEKLGFEFVPYMKIKATLEEIDYQKGSPSEVASRRGMGGDKEREGIVIRPLLEFRDHRGQRVIVKHKNDAFMETKTPREVDPEKLKLLKIADQVSNEWVVDMRLDHVLDKLGNPNTMKDTGDVIRAMIQDIKDESEGEIEWSKSVKKAISSMTAQMYKARITAVKADEMVNDVCHACGEFFCIGGGEFFCIGDCPQMIGQEPEGQGD